MNVFYLWSGWNSKIDTLPRRCSNGHENKKEEGYTIRNKGVHDKGDRKNKKVGVVFQE